VTTQTPAKVPALPRDPALLAYMAFAASLPWGWPAIFKIGTSRVQISDVLVLAILGVWLLRLRRPSPGRRLGLYAAGLAYIAALGASVLFGAEPGMVRLLKLAGYAAYVLLPAISVDLIRDEESLLHVVRGWLAGAAALVALDVLGILAWYVARESAGQLLACPSYGLLRSGNYPRLCGTFQNPNMHANYLIVVMPIALACGTALVPRVWVGVGVAAATLCALFTLSAGVGGYVIAAAIVLLSFESVRRLRLLRFGVIAGAAVAGLFFALTMVAKFVPAGTGHFGAGGRDLHLWASARPALWRSAVETFLAYPLFGKGYGSRVAFTTDPYVILSPDRADQVTGPMPLTFMEAHNAWLNVAGQAGILGLVAFAVLLYEATRGMWRGSPAQRPTRGALDLERLRVALLASVCGAVLYHGIFGALEESKHLWALLALASATVSVRVRAAERVPAADQPTESRNDARLPVGPVASP
jgi:hypothetical protein